MSDSPSACGAYDVTIEYEDGNPTGHLIFVPTGEPIGPDQIELKRRLEAVTAALRRLAKGADGRIDDGKERRLHDMMMMLQTVGLDGLSGSGTHRPMPALAAKELTDFEALELANLRQELGSEAFGNVVWSGLCLAAIFVGLAIVLRSLDVPVEYEIIDILYHAQPVCFGLAGTVLGVALLFGLGSKRASWTQLTVLRKHAGHWGCWHQYKFPLLATLAVFALASTELLRIEVGGTAIDTIATNDASALAIGMLVGLAAELVVHRLVDTSRSLFGEPTQTS